MLTRTLDVICDIIFIYITMLLNRQSVSKVNLCLVNLNNAVVCKLFSVLTYQDKKFF